MQGHARQQTAIQHLEGTSASPVLIKELKTDAFSSDIFGMFFHLSKIVSAPRVQKLRYFPSS
jgi:hypothetical protein